MEYLARINPKYFAAMYQCAAKNDVRYYLNAVNIERHPDGGVIIAATNGHFLGVIHDPDGWIHEDHNSLLVGIPSKRLVSACSTRRGPDTFAPNMLWIAEKFSVVTGCVEATEPPEAFDSRAHLTEKTELVDGKFPDWRKVLPTTREKLETQFPWINGEYIEAFNKIATILTGNKTFGGGGLHLEARDDSRSVVVRLANYELKDRFVGVIMPMKCDPLETIVPAFAMPKSESLEHQAA